MTCSLPALERLQFAPSQRPKAAFGPQPRDRLREFFAFCDGLEQHPFVCRHAAGGEFGVHFTVRDEGPGAVELDFDEFHLESLLTRTRQFVVKGELFFPESLHTAVTEVMRESEVFRLGYNEIIRRLNTKFGADRVLRSESGKGRAPDAGTYQHWLEVRLYSGALHSERRLTAVAGTPEHDVIHAHAVLAGRLSRFLAGASMDVVQQIFNFRRLVHANARDQGPDGAFPFFPEMAEFGRRLTAADQS